MYRFFTLLAQLNVNVKIVVSHYWTVTVVCGKLQRVVEGAVEISHWAA